MYLLSGFTDKPKQSITFTLAERAPIEIKLEYRSQQLGWFFDLAYDTFVLRGQRLSVHPNILRPFKNVLPFGMGVATDLPYEPTDLSALSDGSIRIYLYEEIDEVDTLIDG